MQPNRSTPKRMLLLVLKHLALPDLVVWEGLKASGSLTLVSCYWPVSARCLGGRVVRDVLAEAP